MEQVKKYNSMQTLPIHPTGLLGIILSWIFLGIHHLALAIHNISLSDATAIFSIASAVVGMVGTVYSSFFKKKK